MHAYEHGRTITCVHACTLAFVSGHVWPGAYKEVCFDVVADVA